MTESSQVWSVARKYLAPFGRIQRLENRLDVGWPDSVYTLRRVSGWLELKLVPTSGRCPEHFTLDQLTWGELEVAAGGRWHLLARRGREWVLYDAVGARAWFDGTENAPLIAQTGRFPLRDILMHIAPLRR